MIPLYPTSTTNGREQFVDDKGVLTQFAYYIVNALLNRTGMSGGVLGQVDGGLTAEGTTQATALQLSLDYNEILTTPAGSGAQLHDLKPGQWQYVFNGGANALSVYPADGAKIDALATDAPYALAAGKAQVFTSFELTQLRSFQQG